MCVCVFSDDNDRRIAGLRQDNVGTDDGETVSTQALQHHWNRHVDREDESDGSAST